MYKNSKQRDRILELLLETKMHPAADWIYNELRNEFPNLSMGTVYRNLSILSQQKLIKKIGFGSTFDRYDANIHEHYHFICETCNIIDDIDIPVDLSIQQELKKYCDHTIHSQRVELYGICNNCQE